MRHGFISFIIAAAIMAVASAAAARIVAQQARPAPFPVLPAQTAAPPEPAHRAVSLRPPNELGEVMILEYHRMGEDEGEWVRSADSFRRDLRSLHEAGFRPITVRQLVRGEIDLPSGTSPVVFTFDDSTRGQLYLTGEGEVDAGTFFGIWQAFRAENPDWDGGATWCILPGAEHPSNFFGERPSPEVPRSEREAGITGKVEILVERGHELCNHTMWHARLDRYDDAFVQEQIGSGRDSILAHAPAGEEITTFALPLGVRPRADALAAEGSYRGGRRYRHEAVLEVAGGPTPSPFSRRFDPLSLPRVVMAPGMLERLLAAYEEGRREHYVSDGDAATITVPEGREDEVDPLRAGERTIRVRN